MASEHWRRLLEVFEGASALQESERVAFLDQACEGEPELRAEVEALLGSSQEAESFFGTPAIERAGVETRRPTSGARVGPYRILGELGRGGMGTVMLAERADGEYDAEVAIKFVSSGVFGAEVLEKLRSERQILARLSHPNIARLLDGGTTEEGMPFVVMEYVEGDPIDSYVRRHCLPLERRLELFAAVCQAVHYAHEQGVVHRDLKPGNILVADDGQPKLLDFGIAKVVEDAEGGASVTRTTTRRLTPEYASPEQITGAAVGAFTDVHGLGGILYRLLTGQPPHDLDSTSLLDLERVICRETPIRPSDRVLRGDIDASAFPNSDRQRWVKRLKGDLDTITLKALRIEPERRYPSARALGDDLERYRNALPITARSDSFGYRGGKFLRRHRTETAVGLVTALGVGAAALWSLPAPPPPVVSDALVQGRVAIDVFENRSNDPEFDQLGAMAMDWIVDGVSRTSVVEVVPGSASLAVNQQRETEGGADTVASDARLAFETGAAHVVSGAIYRVGDSLEVRTHVLDARTGTVVQALEPLRANVANATGLLQPLRQRVTAALATVVDPRMADYVQHLDEPPRYEAYEAFIEGVEAYMRFDNTTALERLRTATELEPSYATPKLMLLLPMLGLGRFAEADSITRALEEGDADLAPFEQAALDFLVPYIAGDRRAAYRGSARGAELAPNSILAYQVARDAYELNRPGEAIERLEAIAPDRGFMQGWIPYWSILALAYHTLGDHRSELAVARRGREQHPSSLRALVSEVEAQAARGRLWSLRSLMAEAGGLEPQLGWNVERLGLTVVRELKAHGHRIGLALAMRQLREQLAATPAAATPEDALALALAHYEAEDWAGARARLEGVTFAEGSAEEMRARAVRGLIGVRTGAHDGAEVAARLEADTTAYRFGEPKFWAARLHAVAARTGAAVDALRNAYGDGFPYNIEVHREQDFERLRDEDAFEALHRPVG